MQSIDILFEIQRLFSAEDAVILLSALRQDPLVWFSLQQKDVCQVILEKANGELSEWCPASLALLALGVKISARDLAAEPMTTVEPAVLDTAFHTYEALLKAAKVPGTLQEAGLVALALRERWRQAKSWKGLVQGAVLRPANSGEAVFSLWRTPLACLYGMAPEAEGMLADLLVEKAKETSLRLVSHTLLAQPVSLVERAQRMAVLIKQVPEAQQRAWLRLLKQQGQESLAARLAQMLMAELSPGVAEQKLVFMDHDPGRVFQRITELQRLAELQYFAGQGQQAYSTLMTAKEAMLGWEAGVELKIAEIAMETPGMETALPDFERLEKFNPDARRLQAEALLSLEGAAAKALLDEHAKVKSAHPLVQIRRAEALNQEGKRQQAQQLASEAVAQIIHEVASQQSIYTPKFTLDWKPVRLLRSLISLDLKQEALQLGLLLLQGRPVDIPLIHIIGQLLEKLGNLPGAIHYAHTAVMLEPENPQWHRWMAQLWELKGDWEKALQEWNKVLGLSKQPTVEDLAAYMRCALKANQPQRAMERGAEILEREPNHGLANALMGQALAQSGELQEAIPYLSRATLLMPEEPESWLLLAEVYRRLGESQKRLETLRSAIQSLPEIPAVVVALADACLAIGSLAEALPFLKKAAELLPESLEAVLKLGTALRAMGFLTEARQVFEQARQRWEEEPKLAFAYAETLAQLGEAEKALPVLDSAIQSNAPEFDWYLLYTQLLVKNQNPFLEQDIALDQDHLDKAQEALEKALKIVPEDFRGRLYLAEVLAAKGKDEEAFEIYRNLVECGEAQTPEWLGRVQGGLGRVAFALNQIETALAALKEATLAEPGDLSLQRYLAETYLSAGLFEDAVQIARHVLRMTPDDLNSLIWFTNVALRADQKSEAKEAMQSAVQLAPDDPDYRIQLAEVQLGAGESEAARQTLHTLIHLIDLSIKQLRQIAYLFVRLDDFESALACLQKALDASQGADNGILFEMAGLLAQMGSLDKALEIIERAISSVPENIFQYLLKADVLTLLQRPRAAIECLEQVLKRIELPDGIIGVKWAGKLTDSILPEEVAASMETPTAIYLRLIALQRWLGNLTTALEYAGKALSNDPGNWLVRSLAADLYQAALQNDQALELAEYVEVVLPQLQDDLHSLLADQREAIVSLQCLRVEAALEAGSEVRASQLFNEQLADSTDHPRVMACQARLLLRQGDWQMAGDLFDQAWTTHLRSRVTEEDSPRKTAGIQDILPSALVDQGLWLVPALLEMHKWTEALQLSQEVIQVAPLEGRPYLEFIKALVVCAERQRLCDELKCKVHVPGASILSKEGYSDFEEALQKARQIGEAEILDRWQARGMAVFRPSPQNVRALVNHSQEAVDTAAVMAALRRINNPAAAVQLAQRAPKLPEVLLQLALCHLDDDPEKSVQVARRAVEACPADPIYQTGLALVAARAGQSSLALEALEAALGVWPDEPEWHAWAAQFAEQLQMYEATLQHREKMVELQPQNVDYALSLAHSYLQAGLSQKAIEVLRRAGEEYEERPEIWAGLAEAYFQSGMLEKAFECVERASQLNGASPDLFLRCGEAALQMGNETAALEYGQKALNARPDRAEAVLFTSRVLQKMGKAKEALNGINVYFNSGYSSVPLRLEQAELVRELESAKAAVPILEELVQEHPEDVEMLAKLAYTLAEANDIKGAENTAYIALQQQPDHAGLNLLMGRLKRAERQLDQAIHYLSETIRNHPAQVEAYLELGETYQERREDLQALRIYQQAIKVAPSDPRPYYHAAMILRETKDYAGAETMLRRAAQIAPDDLNVRRQLGAIIALNLVHNSQEANVHL